MSECARIDREATDTDERAETENGTATLRGANHVQESRRRPTFSMDVNDDSDDGYSSHGSHHDDDAISGSDVEGSGDDMSGSGSYDSESYTETDEEDSGDDSSEIAEPWLKYHRLSSQATQLLTKFAASCLTIHEHFMVLGTYQGVIFCLDLIGTELLRYNAHGMTVNSVSIDQSGKFIGSCSEDGSVVVQGVNWKPDANGHATVRSQHAVVCHPLLLSRHTLRPTLATWLTASCSLCRAAHTLCSLSAHVARGPIELWVQTEHHRHPDRPALLVHVNLLLWRHRGKVCPEFQGLASFQQPRLHDPRWRRPDLHHEVGRGHAGMGK